MYAPTVRFLILCAFSGSHCVEHEYDDLCNDTSLQLRICSGIISGETTPSKILELKGDEIRASFDSIRNGLIGAIDFLKRELKVKSFQLLPFPGLIVPLAAFFVTENTEGYRYTDIQKEKIIKWFWRSLFSRRFSASVNERQAHDIKEMIALKENQDHDFKFPTEEISINFKKTAFSVRSANTRTFILLLSQFNPHSFLSGARIDLAKILQKINKNEFHHIFPQKHLEQKGVDKKLINVLANICFLTRGDNNRIKDKAPSVYAKEINTERKASYLENALCPQNFEELEYDQFLEERSNIIKAKIEALIT